MRAGAEESLELGGSGPQDGKVGRPVKCIKAEWSYFMTRYVEK